ncbi:MAG: C45 family peptidase [Burkholderiaceae bacterium]|nr:C45 family peptidase [Burkholderiaceae bacterium]
MLNYLDLSGTHHEVGAALGRFGAKALHHYAQISPGWKHIMRFRQHPMVQSMQELVREHHPQYWAELQGMAQGLEMPFEDVFVWNCRGDLWAWGPDGCTTVQQPGAQTLLAHNEDGDPLFAGHCGIAHIQAGLDIAFTAFVYPGSIPGHTFGANAKGLCMTVNNLRTLHAKPGVPRMIVTRQLISLPTIASATLYLRSIDPAGGFHVTLGQAGTDTLTSIEFTNRHTSIINVSEPAGHANHMIHSAMRHQPQIITGSSGFRQARLEQILNAQPSAEPLKILFDTDNSEFPISGKTQTTQTPRTPWLARALKSRQMRYSGKFIPVSRSSPCTD